MSHFHGFHGWSSRDRLLGHWGHRDAMHGMPRCANTCPARRATGWEGQGHTMIPGWIEHGLGKVIEVMEKMFSLFCKRHLEGILRQFQRKES